MIEDTFGSDLPYHKKCPKNGTDHEIRLIPCPSIDYRDMAEYIKIWPEKLVGFVAERICDDDFRDFARQLYIHICSADDDGPDFEDWRRR